MNCHKTALFTLAALLSVAGTSTTWAQFGRRGNMDQAPPMLGDFKPIVGAGSEYQLTNKDRNTTFTMLVVGKETVDGAEGYWMESRAVAWRAKWSKSNSSSSRTANPTSSA